MSEHRNPRKILPKQPTPDNHRTARAEPAPEPPPSGPDDEVDHLICVLRDQLRRADSYVTSAEKELVESWGTGESEGEDSDDDVQRRRCRVEDLVEAGKLVVREARYTSDQLAAELDMQRKRRS